MQTIHERTRCAITALADDAVEAVLARLYTQFPQIQQHFGDAGRRACRDDLRFHLAYIDGALAAEDAPAFGAYVSWVAGLLESRGVPTTSLAVSLEALEACFAARLTPPEFEAAAAVLAAGHAALRDTPVRPASDFDDASAHHDARLLADQLTQGDRRAVRHIVERAAGEGLHYLDIGVRLFQQALYRVGDLWCANRISVAQEHLATSMTQSLLAQAYGTAEFAAPRARHVVCACVEGNFHAVGLRLVSDAFELGGWEVSHLGANVPTRDLAAYADARKPDLIALSVATSSQLASLRTATAMLRADLGVCCPPLLIGGLTANSLPGLWRRLGADEWRADALGVLALARE